MTYGARDFANELRIGAWNTAGNERIFDQVEHVLDADPAELLAEEDEYLNAHERQDAQYDVEHGHAAFMLDCGHALPEHSIEHFRHGPEKYCGICSRWVKAAR